MAKSQKITHSAPCRPVLGIAMDFLRLKERDPSFTKWSLGSKEEGGGYWERGKGKGKDSEALYKGVNIRKSSEFRYHTRHTPLIPGTRVSDIVQHKSRAGVEVGGTINKRNSRLIS